MNENKTKKRRRYRTNMVKAMKASKLTVGTLPPRNPIGTLTTLKIVRLFSADNRLVMHTPHARVGVCSSPTQVYTSLTSLCLSRFPIWDGADARYGIHHRFPEWYPKWYPFLFPQLAVWEKKKNKYSCGDMEDSFDTNRRDVPA